MQQTRQTLFIMGIPWKVSEVDVVSKGESLAGQIDYSNQEIRIDKDLPIGLKTQTLMHEMMHAICWQLGLYDISDNESAIQGIASALFSVCFENNVIFNDLGLLSFQEE